MLLLTIPVESIINDYRNGCTLAEISASYGCSAWAIKHRLLQSGERLNRRGPRRTYTLNEEMFEKIETEAQAYWLGFLLADGRVSQTGSGNWICRVDLATIDRCHLVSLADAVGSNAPIPIGHDGESVYIDLCSAKLCRALVSLECGPNKTSTHGTPCVPVELMHHFYRGFFDGDGSLFYMPKNHAWRFDVVGSPRFIRDCQHWLVRNVNVAYTKLIVPKSSPVSLTCRYSGGTQIERICRTIYRDATIWLPRKFATYQALLVRPQR